MPRAARGLRLPRPSFERALCRLLEEYKDIDAAERADELDRQSEGLRDEAANK